MTAAYVLAGKFVKAEARHDQAFGNTKRFCAALLARNSDVAMMEITFRQAGFDVVDARHDLATQEMRQALRQFADRAQVGPLERHVRSTSIVLKNSL